MKEIGKKMATIKEFLRDKNERKGIINDAFMKDEISKDQYIQEMNLIDLQLETLKNLEESKDLNFRLSQTTQNQQNEQRPGTTS